MALAKGIDGATMIRAGFYLTLLELSEPPFTKENVLHKLIRGRNIM